MSRLAFLALVTAVAMRAAIAPAEPPKAPEGFKWRLNPAFSDEFEGTTLDAEKWHDHNPFWKGRPPGKFMPSSISVGDGCLQIRCQPLDPPIEDYSIACGAVQSKSADARFGYYECRMKASGLTTSSTFWLFTRNKPSRYGRIGLELDIMECIGDARRWPSFRTHMHSNTHIHLHPNAEGEALLERLAAENPTPAHKIEKINALPLEERKKALAKLERNRRILKKGNMAELASPVDEAFHTYGCWWVDANTMHFYADGVHVYTITPETMFDPTPFDAPLRMNLICETYDWETPPTRDELLNDKINVTRYDYVRAYTLKKAGE